jgi:hypothetical protein
MNQSTTDKTTSDLTTSDLAAQASNILSNEKGGIAIPAVMYFMGAPFLLVLLLWFFFFRG